MSAWSSGIFFKPLPPAGAAAAGGALCKPPSFPASAFLLAFKSEAAGAAGAAGLCSAPSFPARAFLLALKLVASALLLGFLGGATGFLGGVGIVGFDIDGLVLGEGGGGFPAGICSGALDETGLGLGGAGFTSLAAFAIMGENGTVAPGFWEPAVIEGLVFFGGGAGGTGFCGLAIVGAGLFFCLPDILRSNVLALDSRRLAFPANDSHSLGTFPYLAFTAALISSKLHFSNMGSTFLTLLGSRER
mmetsp:Transcript_9676/g.15888  ORF Transcript_9676/g.15888 Transcript_9676/m.15888 type:complete len:246 (-) Transcript_9676:32-769(-)